MGISKPGLFLIAAVALSMSSQCALIANVDRNELPQEEPLEEDDGCGGEAFGGAGGEAQGGDSAGAAGAPSSGGQGGSADPQELEGASGAGGSDADTGAGGDSATEC